MEARIPKRSSEVILCGIFISPNVLGLVFILFYLRSRLGTQSLLLLNLKHKPGGQSGSIAVHEEIVRGPRV